MLLTRIITAVVLLCLLLGGLFYLPSQGWALALLTLLVAGGVEWANLARYTPVARTAFCLILLGSAGFVFPGNIFASTAVTAVLAASVLFWLLLAPLWLYRGWKVSNPWLLAAAGWTLLLPTWLALVLMQAYPWALLAILGVVWIADSAAYFAGHRWGRRKLAPAISPGKTWEGVAGGALAVAIYFGLVWSLGFQSHAPEKLLTSVLLVAALFPLSILGDLFESWIKRQAGVKDSGRLLPGHGGVLDRIDALTSTLPLAALAWMCWFTQR